VDLSHKIGRDGMNKADRIRERHVKSFTMKTLSEHIHIRTGRSKYTGDTVLAVLVWTAMCHEFVEGVARNLLNIWRMVVPSGDTVRRWIECLTPGDVRSSLLSCNSDVLEKARSMRLLTHPVVCALDCNDREYYGKKTSGLIVGGKHKNGTNWFYRIATLCVVEKGIRFEIAATEYNIFSSLPKVVRRLIEDALRHVRIRHLLMDRAFSTVEIRHMLTDMGISYVMPIETNDRIDREVKATHGLRFRHIEWTTTFRCITDTTTLIVIDRDEGRQQKHRSSKSVYWLYVTNMSVTDGNVADICRFYDARWGIESGYRIDDHEFTGRTTSHNESLRLFYLFLSVLLRNIWTLFKLLLGCTGAGNKAPVEEFSAGEFRERFGKEFRSPS